MVHLLHRLYGVAAPVSRSFHWCQDRGAEDRQRAEVLAVGQHHHELGGGGLGSAVSSRAEFAAKPRPPKGFPLHVFSALRMASPDITILLIIVDHHAATEGGKTPVPIAMHLAQPLFAYSCLLLTYLLNLIIVCQKSQ